jgi:hypothetical protein
MERCLMNDQKRRKIPKISPDRLDISLDNRSTPITNEEKKAQSFLKGKEVVKQFPLRMPLSLYKKLSRVAFDEDIKINRILVELIEHYVRKQSNNK